VFENRLVRRIFESERKKITRGSSRMALLSVDCQGDKIKGKKLAELVASIRYKRKACRFFV
jgi:hypothetical protein